MKRVALSLLLLAFASPVAADFEAGRRAANSGNFSLALREWQPLADQGDREAQYAIGRMYARGDGVTKDFPKAFQYWKKSAEQGLEKAELGLGKMYLRGDGVERNPSEARWWLDRAAKKGNAEAIYLARQLPASTIPTSRNTPTPVTAKLPPADDSFTYSDNSSSKPAAVEPTPQATEISAATPVAASTPEPITTTAPTETATPESQATAVQVSSATAQATPNQWISHLFGKKN